METAAIQGQRNEQDTFLRAMRNMAATVCIIAAKDGAVRSGLTATAMTSVSMDPPTLLVCVNRTSNTCALIDRVGSFSVNVLAEDQAAIATTFSGAQLDKFQAGQWLDRDGLPILDCPYWKARSLAFFAASQISEA